MKATFLLGLVALICLVFHRISAATRHLLWTLSLCAALLLPFLSIVEVWEVPVLPAQLSSWNSAPSNQVAKTNDDLPLLPVKGMQRNIKVSPEKETREAKPHDFQPTVNRIDNTSTVTGTSDVYALPQQSSTTLLSTLVNWALAIWFAGVLLLLFKLLVGFMATHLLTRGAVEFKDPKMTGLFSSLLNDLQLKGRVRLLRSERTLMPIVCGVLRPAVLLPAGADDWSEERRRMVLLHELTHVTRRDCLSQMMAQTACAIYWFNPLAWYGARRLRVEREQACDDYVLSIGTKPSDYAHHLLEIARYLQEQSVFQWSQTTTVAMARRSQLEGRLLAILSKEGKSRAMSQVMTAGVTTLMFVLFLSLAVVRPTVSRAQHTQSSAFGLTEETNAAEKSPSGLLVKKIEGLRDEAIIQSALLREISEKQDNNARADVDSQGKILNAAQIEHVVKTESGHSIEAEVAEDTAPPQPESFPLPPAILEPSLPAGPFVKAKYQQERASEKQDKSGDFIDEMASVGYTNLSIKELVQLKASGVTAAYVRGLNALGISNLTTKELAGMCVNDVTPTFIQAIRNAGYKELTTKDLVSFSVHGVTPEFINRLRNAGYGNLSARQLIRIRRP